jgi:type II secretory ATPase GspE/PulE/Tfp pilus assembly ATPase PilB-like protein
MATRNAKRLIGEFLILKRFLKEEELRQALAEQQKTRELLGVVLIRMGFVSEDTVNLAIMANQLDVDFIHLKDVKPQAAALALLPAKFVNHYHVFPVSLRDGVLSVAMSNPLDIQTLDDLALVAKARISPILATEKDIQEAIKEHYGVGADTVDRLMTGRPFPREEASSTEIIDAQGSEASISRYINQILLQAYRDHATDVHIEPFEDEVRVRYRIDGVLYDANAPENLRFFRDVLISRIKIMANLNIAEKRLPQDGRFKVQAEGEELDLRVSFLPTPFGESVVMRLLNSVRLFSFEELGYAGRERTYLKALLDKPHGIIFVTGPTGSGKTTTLYTCLSSVNRDDTKIITVEDPVEYQLKGITQVQVHSSIGLTFASTLRSMLRHDPDILMVGEVRDPETAEITIQAALTGHLVFSTLHTNDAASSVTRLLDMGVEPYLIASSVECFIAQRLVRLLCPHCRVPARMDFATARAFRLNPEQSETPVYEARGCKACRMTGYQGRLAVAEFLLVDDAIRTLISARAPAGEIKARAVESGMKTLREHGWEKIKEGLTSPSEVIRVIQ